LLRLYIYANTDIPSGVEVDYIKGVWVVSPLDNLLFESSKGAKSYYNEIFDQMLSTLKIVYHE